MDLLGAADEANRGHAVAPAIERFFRGRDDRGMVGQAEVVVGAEVEDIRPAGHSYMSALRSGDDSLGFVEPGRFDFGQGPREILPHLGEHDYRSLHLRITLPELPVRIASKPFSKPV